MPWTKEQEKEIYDLTKENAVILKRIDGLGCVKGEKAYQTLNSRLWVIVLLLLGSLLSSNQIREGIAKLFQ